MRDFWMDDRDPSAGERAENGQPGGRTAAILSAIAAEKEALVRRGPELERTGLLPDELVAWMRSLRLFKLFVPEAFGGAGLTLGEAVRIYEALSAVDGSLGWLAQIGSGGGYFVPSFRPEIARAFFSPPEAVIAGTGHPAGRARRVPGGYVVSGRWRYASGAQYATLFTANAVVEGSAPSEEGGGPASGGAAAGAKVSGNVVRAFAFFPEEVELERDWSALGMVATSGWTFSVRERFVPEERSFVVGEALWDPGLLVYRLPFSLFAEASIGAVCIGLGRGFFEAALGEDAPTEAEVREVVERLRAEADDGRLLFFAAVAEAERRLSAGTLDEAAARRLGGAMRRAAHAQRSAVVRALPFLGMRAIRPEGQLNRRFRDLVTACQHVVLRPAPPAG
ncbi:MAG: acyl-CoA dehydrogenase family protein [Hydrogenibacillus schlegelii]|uniref:Acyl-CoA dehydrogenase family protein n=1 Tax=Hydrogenibacillus schlegelii TaxID=1484 RepID=A0A947CYT0_HYDSH|nr:acyl-CoA dehydrogenase family protein [Hydrogenibacillus schlegelii]